MVEMGFLRRRRLREDRRVVRLGLTEEGRQLIEELVRRVDAFETETLAGIGTGELNSFISTTCKIRINYVALEKSMDSQQDTCKPPS